MSNDPDYEAEMRKEAWRGYEQGCRCDTCVRQHEKDTRGGRYEPGRRSYVVGDWGSCTPYKPGDKVQTNNMTATEVRDRQNAFTIDKLRQAQAEIRSAMNAPYGRSPLFNWQGDMYAAVAREMQRMIDPPVFMVDPSMYRDLMTFSTGIVSAPKQEGKTMKIVDPKQKDDKPMNPGIQALVSPVYSAKGQLDEATRYLKEAKNALAIREKNHKDAEVRFEAMLKAVKALGGEVHETETVVQTTKL